MVEHRKARLALSVILVVGGLSGAATLASPAQASEAIESFTTTSSTSQAGGHPDLETSFSLSSPGVPEAARNVVFNAPRGLAGNTNAVEQCTTSSFALDECPTDSQAGLITVRARYEGNPGYLLGTAPIYVLVPQEGEVARFAFIVPTLNIPIAIPLTVRTASDYGLRFSVSDISQLTPLSSAKLIIWGFPASSIHDSQRFVKGAPGEPAGCPALADASCTPGLKANIPNDPLTINPTTCTGESPITSLEVQTYQDPQHNSTAQDSYPPITGCENEDFNPVIEASLTTGETDAPSGLNLELKAHQFEGLSASPSELRSSTLTLPPDLTINPDAADGQSACTDAQANFDSEGPAECPDNSKIGTFAIGSPTLDGPLAGSVYIGEPKPGNQYRLFMTASGFGMNIKLIGIFRRTAPASLRNLSNPSVRIRQRPDGDPDGLHVLHDQRRCLPLECVASRSDFEPGLRARLRPAWQRMPRPDPPIRTESGGRHLQPQRRRLLLIHPEARSRGRRSVSRQAELHNAAWPDRQPARNHLLP
jgi:hypothetical protein